MSVKKFAPRGANQRTIVQRTMMDVVLQDPYLMEEITEEQFEAEGGMKYVGDDSFNLLDSLKRYQQICKQSGFIDQEDKYVRNDSRVIRIY